MALVFIDDSLFGVVNFSCHVKFGDSVNSDVVLVDNVLIGYFLTLGVLMSQISSLRKKETNI